MAAGIVALTLVAYVPAMDAGAIWDDDIYVFGNNHIRADDGLKHFWLTIDQIDYYPVTHTSWWLERHLLWGDRTGGYHVVNIVLHALGSVLIWRVLLRLGVPGAWVVAAIFAVHPVAAGSTAWIAQRKNVMSMCWMAAAVLAYLDFDDSRRWRSYVAAVAAFLLAVLSKSSVVMVPIVLLLTAWWRHSRIGARDVLRAAPFFAISLVFGLISIYTQFKFTIASTDPRPEGAFSRLAASGWCVGFYWLKDLAPLRLSMIYPRWTVDPGWWPAWLPLIGLVAVLVWAWRRRAGWGRAVLFAVGYFIVIELPVLGISKMGYQRYSLVADHLQYLGLIAPIALVVAAGHRVMKRQQAVGRVAAALVIGVSAALTWQRASVFETPRSLWDDTLKKNPRSLSANYNMAAALQQLGELEESSRYFHVVLELNPKDAGAYYNLGINAFRRQRLDAAIDFYHRALALKPEYGEAHHNLAVAFQDKGDGDWVRHHFLSLKYRGNDMFARRSFREATAFFQPMVQLQPENGEAHFLLGRALYMAGDKAAAARHLRQAVRLDRSLREKVNELGLNLDG